MTGFAGRIREWLFGAPVPSSPKRHEATALIEKISHGSLQQLTDPELMKLLQVILDDPQLSNPLRGNQRFLSSIATHYAAKNRLSAKQRRATLNILEKAYPHNLAFELRKF